MSTTFDVFPSKDYIPTYRELLGVATEHLNRFLLDHGIKTDVKLAVDLRAKNQVETINLDARCWWDESQYAWFHVPGVPGGAYANTHLMREDEDDLGKNSLPLQCDVGASKMAEFAVATENSLKIGRFWWIGRSGGQPAIIYIAYGMLAASLAELTEGFIYSTDSASSYLRLPAWPSEFHRLFFHPEMMDELQRDWAKRCIQSLPDELRTMTTS